MKLVVANMQLLRLTLGSIATSSANLSEQTGTVAHGLTHIWLRVFLTGAGTSSGWASSSSILLASSLNWSSSVMVVIFTLKVLTLEVNDYLVGGLAGLYVAKLFGPVP